MKATVGYCLGILAAVTTHVSAQCVQLQAGQTPLLFNASGASASLPVPTGATGLVAFLPSAANQNQIERVVATAPATPGPVTVNDAFVQAVMQNTAERSQYRVAFVGTGNALLTPTPFPFFLAPFETSAACGAQVAKPAAKPAPATASSGDRGAPTPATPLECDQVAADTNRKPVAGAYESWLLFDSTGALCYAPYPLRQRDKLRFGMVFRSGETIAPGITASVTNCSTPTPQPTIYGDVTKLKDLKLQDATVARNRFEVHEIGMPVECASDSPTVKVSIPQDGGTIATRDQALKLFPRYNAAFHVGVLQSKLHKTDYQVENSIIINREPEDRGPEYVAMVVIQALPKTLLNRNYQGRDLIHDNDPADRLGLAFSFGIQDPGSRFGLGLAYELARGVNVVGVHEWVRRTRLNGVSVGDTFTGTNLPTRKQWDKGWSLGLTFDIEYITKVFGAQGK